MITKQVADRSSSSLADRSTQRDSPSFWQRVPLQQQLLQQQRHRFRTDTNHTIAHTEAHTGADTHADVSKLGRMPRVCDHSFADSCPHASAHSTDTNSNPLANRVA